MHLSFYCSVQQQPQTTVDILKVIIVQLIMFELKNIDIEVQGSQFLVYIVRIILVYHNLILTFVVLAIIFYQKL